MKRSIPVVLSISLFVIIACNQASDKKDQKNIALNETTEASEAVKKDIPAKADATKWKADAANSKINFKIKGPFGMVDGNVKGLKSTIIFDEKDLGSSFIEASVDAKTIDTDNNLRDKDLKKEKFLDTDDHSIINFRSSKIEKNGNAYKAVGDLTLKGTKKQIAIPFDFTPNGNGGTFKGSFTIDRNDFNVGKEGGTVGKTITINLEVPVTK